MPRSPTPYMFEFIRKIIGGGPDFSKLIAEVGSFESEFQKLSGEDLSKKTTEFKERHEAGEPLADLMPEVFALVREAAKRTLGQRHFDVQLMGGAALHRGAITEMLTGEGKTLAATSPVYLNALTGRGVHVVTVNEYLAKRDTVLMGQIYHALGMKVTCLVHEGALLYDPEWKIAKEGGALIDRERDTTGNFLVQDEYLRLITRREAYLADITYGTNHEFGFDYLRDNLAYSFEGQVQRGHYFAIIDEADSILIDEARTPLIIAAPDAASSDFYKVFANVSKKLLKDDDYIVDEKLKTVAITDQGIDKVEKMTGIKNIYSPENFRLVHYLEESLRATALYMRDRDYVEKEGEIIIVDQFTGRLMLGRRYSGGLHQAIEAKEGVRIKEESQTYARISLQNYFRLYEKLSGMTGTAQTSAEEFHKVYDLEVISIPPNRELIRKDLPDIVYKTSEEKYEAVAEEVKRRHELGQPVLLGTPSIEKNELISGLLRRAGVPHELLNAKNNEREGAIIAQAGRSKAIMVATNMAGRGVDIILGGNPVEPEGAKRVREVGGLHVIGTERHDARRIDNQLRGRSGRQGDPGSSQFFLSLEDDLLRIFGGDRIQSMMTAFNIPKGTPIESKFISKAVSQAQSKVEGMNFDARKHLLEYDDVLNKQRLSFYKRRQEFLTTLNKEEIAGRIHEIALAEVEKIKEQVFVGEEYGEESLKRLREVVTNAEAVKDGSALAVVFAEMEKLSSEAAAEKFGTFMEGALYARSEDAANDPTIVPKILSMLDMLWMSHLENMDGLSESVRLRAYAQHDPLVEYRQEGHRLYQELFANFGSWVFMNVFRSISTDSSVPAMSVSAVPSSIQHRQGVVLTGGDKVGRNDPCPCGSGKKYKKCHGA